jgi:UDP-N-acetylmuramate: L-alanyl-gamma-D-glutamyl-meso-diaminopimelate ligase
LLARQHGFTVTGSDANLYPPMSTLLAEQGIEVMEGYEPAHLQPAPDCVVVGNVMSRGNPAVEYMLQRGMDYTSGPEFLSRFILKDRWVLAVAGTHGKTTTSSLLCWILEAAGLTPGFLVGGVPENFGISARLGNTPFFVVEADEYDTAFFDKRSKFVHYRPRTVILNNLEYDHADIFPDLESIKRQFHHLLRMVPSNGLVVAPVDDANIQDVLAQGCWTPTEHFAVQQNQDALWLADNIADDTRSFDVICGGNNHGRVEWALQGLHSIRNALAAIAAARHAGVPVAESIRALYDFRSVKRRMELRGQVGGVTVYDDFAHHPTAIETTLDGARRQLNGGRLIAVLEPRSNTMRMGVHREGLAQSLRPADKVYLYQPDDLGWSLQTVADELPAAVVANNVDDLVNLVSQDSATGDHVVIMSNGAFGGIHDKLLQALENKTA